MHPQSNSSGFPLSPNQRRLWWLQREGAVYNTVVVLRLRGPLEPPRLDAALAEVWGRHDGLSACFVQRSDLRFPLQARALGRVPGVEALSPAPGSLEDPGQQLARRGLGHRFDLASGPLLYAARMSLSDTEHLLLLARPSLTGDAQAQCRFAEELLAAYAGRALDEEPGLEHAQYAEWQNQLLAEPEPAAAEHWARATAQVKPLTLPFERLRRAAPFQPSSVEVRFAQGLALPGSLLALARTWRVAPSTLLAAAWSAVAARWLETPELVLGYVEPARAYDELKRVQGLVSKTLPLGVPLEADQSLAHAARALEESLTQARDWVEHFAWDAREETARASLPVAFEFQDARLGPVAGAPECRVERLLGASDGFVLKLSCVEDARGLTCEVLYDAQAVDEATARLVARMLSDFLMSVSREPDRVLSGHGLLEPSALQPLRGPSETEGRLPTVVELFERCVRSAPDAVALVQGSRRRTYAQVGEEVHRLARHLRAQGVRAESVVAVAADRSIETVTAMLAILEAGGAFLPIDPAYPPERIDYMLRDADVRLAVGAQARREAFGRAPRFLALDESPRPWAGEAPEALPVEEAPSRLAYVLYTSGSTGQPKGCQLEVHNLSHYIGWANTYYFEDGRAEGHFGLYTSLSFDLTLTSVFCALTRGRTLHVFDGAQETLEVLRAMFTPGSGIDIVKMTPSHISLLDTLGLPGTGVRKVIAGGEALTREHLLILRGLASDLQLYNEYGPTETTVGCVVKQVELDDDRVLIGTPIARTQVVVLDEAGRVLPPLVAGELWIAGEGVGRGYARAPERSAEKFKGHPQLAAHAYRTGDKVRQLASGELDYLGRIDDQVKVRGYRIEPGEIEQALLRHPAVKQALVMARPVRGPELELVAYVVSTEELSAAALRELLRRTLPEHMVPGWFVRMERMPLTRNGKVDRAVLPAPREQGAAAVRVAPRTPLEERIARVWEAVLGQEHLGVHDVFSERGGHSLKAMMVVGRIGQELGLSLTLRELFEAPTIAGMAALLERRGARERAEEIPLAPVAEHYALSDAQRRFWALEQMDGLGSAYLIRAAFVAEGPLDVGALERAFAGLLARHESLRTSFLEVEGEPRQRVHAQARVPLEVVELPGASVDDAAVRAQVEETARPFDLTQAPLVRVRVLRLSPTRALLVFAMHHIIGDGWSVAVLAREWTQLYAREVSGGGPELPPLRLHPKDYQLWRLARLAGPEGEAHRAYWHERLKDPPGALELPVSSPRPAVRSYRGGSVSLRLPEAATRGLMDLARRQEATLFMALVASVKALLYRYTGQQDLVVGTAIAGRGHPDVEHHLGAYLNLLVLRDPVRGSEDFSALLGSVRQTAREAYEHSEYPFDRLVRELDVSHDASRSPLFDVLVVLQNNELPVLAMRDVTLSAHPLPVSTSAYDLSFEFSEEAGGLVCELHYNADLFGERRVLQLAEHWRTLVSSVVEAPSAALDRLRMLSSEEHRALAGVIEHEEVAGPDTLTEAVRERVAREPRALAVVCGTHRLSLGELVLGAHRIARHLVEEQGLRPGEVVAVVGARTEWIPMALVGVLEAGGIYLPLDADHPLERVRLLLEDSGARVVLADARWAGLLAGGGIPVLELETVATRGEARSPGRRARPEDVAALIYTSGSTGKPKGVRMEQRGILNTAREFNRLCGVEPGGRVLQFASLAFDAALLEMTMSLVGGAALVVASREVIEDTSAFTAYLETHQVSFAILPPVYLSTLERHELPTVKTLVTAGEAPNAADARYYAARKRYINAYGPAECSVCVTMHEVKEGEEGAIAVGRPLRNVGVVVADGALNALPVGVVGEVCVSGVGVARGYLGREELTAQRFVDHPEYGRLYRTGDLGRWREDGALEYVGRGDEQVKVRGQRVELEEVRRKLLEYGGVEEAVVLARKAAAGVELVGYVVGGAGVKAEEVRGWLGEALPTSMVPASLRVVDKLPLTSNGKVDKQALALLELEPAAARPPEREAATEAERVLAQVWREVLGRPQVGWRDNYFELGGDSIKAIRMAARLKQQGWGLEVRQVFMHPGLEELARQMKPAQGRPEGERGEATGEVELTGVQRWWAGKVKAEERNHFNNAVMLQVQGRVEGAAMRRALHKVGQVHEALRLRWRQQGGELKQEYAGVEAATQLAEGMVEGEVKGEGWQEELEREAEQLQGSLDLEKGPVARLGLYATPEGARAVWVVHHVAVDAVSWGVLVEDLASAYVQCLEGKQPVLPTRTASFQSWSLSLRRHAERIPETERAHWDEVDRALRSIPTPGEKTAAPTRNRDSLHMALMFPAHRTRQLLGEAHRAYGTQAGELVLVALARALRTWLGDTRIALAMEGHGRAPELMRELDVSRTVGWFTCLYPLVLELVARDDVGHHIKQVKESLRSVPSQGVGYGVLRYAPGAPPVGAEPSISFNYLGQAAEGSTYPAPFAPASEPVGTLQHPNAPRLFALDVLAAVDDGALRVELSFDAHAFRQERMQALLDSLRQELEHVTAHCLAQKAPELTPSDLDYAGMSISELDAVMNSITEL